MAKKPTKTDENQQAPTVTDEAPQAQSEPTFERLEIIRSAHLFGTTPEIMAGALVDVNKEQFTKQEAADAVKTFLVRPVGKE